MFQKDVFMESTLTFSNVLTEKGFCKKGQCFFANKKKLNWNEYCAAKYETSVNNFVNNFD